MKIKKTQDPQILEKVFIPLKDGRKLAARIWLPEDAENKPAPAILEYLPYRKRDGTARRDDSTYPVFCEAGYAGVRVDISGTGESDGDFDDEYSPREHDDGIEVINWIDGQKWCDGNIGMMGISWGGFNSLQIAARQPEALKAVIAIGTTVDRYNDDIHYKNGCLLSANFSWSSTMQCFASRAPDPELVGRSWRKMWRHRLQTQPLPLETWLAHQRRDEYWKHGSVGENYDAIKIPSMVISGWADGYINAPPAMAANSKVPCKAINGPWVHLYPHYALPKPRMDFHAEAISWWDRWLKNVNNNAESLPEYRAYISEAVRPGENREREQGRWVAEDQWPSEHIKQHQLYLSGSGQLQQIAAVSDSASICSPQDCGVACGEFFTMKTEGDACGDQRIDDAGSLIFETDLLAKNIDVLGRPIIKLKVAIDQPNGNLAVRLIDVHPDGVSHRVSWGVLNLAHRRSHENPKLMTPGKAELAEIALDQCGYRFRKGHKIRVSISTAYWPMILPQPDAVTATIEFGESTYVSLPVRPGNDSTQVTEPTASHPLPDYPIHLAPDNQRSVIKDLVSGATQYRSFEDTGEIEVPPHGMRTRHTHEQCFAISPSDPLSATAHSTYISIMQRGDWRVRTVSESSLSCNRTHYFVKASTVAWEGDKVINRRNWEFEIKRDFT